MQLPPTLCGTARMELDGKSLVQIGRERSRRKMPGSSQTAISANALILSRLSWVGVVFLADRH